MRRLSTIPRLAIILSLLPLLLASMVVLTPAAPVATAQEAGADALGTIGVVVKSNFSLKPAGQCGDDARCGHIHMKIDPDGETCNLPGKPYNSMNSDFGGDLIKAHLGACPTSKGEHVIGVLLANDRHQPVLVNGKPVTALRRITVR